MKRLEPVCKGIDARGELVWAFAPLAVYSCGRIATIHPNGFTLVELMIVVAIIGILAAIAIPQFAGLVAKSREASTKGNLGVLRSAIAIYYADMEGFYPSATNNVIDVVLTSNGRYLKEIPNAYFPSTRFNVGHATSNFIWTYLFGYIGGSVSDAKLMAPLAESQGMYGGWVYDSVTTNATWGMILPNCAHSDEKGRSWTLTQ